MRFRAPPAPTLTLPPAFVNVSTVTLTGNVDAGARIDAVVEDRGTATAAADAAGAFAIVVDLAPNVDNTVRVYATAHGGDGLTSAAAEAVVGHDDRAPDVTILQPAANGYVHGTISFIARATDGGSGTASIGFAAPGRPLGVALNPDPAQPFTGAVSLDTTTLADGAHTLTATATDRAGNVAVVSRTPIVDNTPPDTAIVSGPSGTTPDTTVTFTFNGTDAVTPPASLEFAWRVAGGAWSSFSAETSTTIAGLAQGPHTFEVKTRDLALNEDPTPAASSFTVGGLRVTITEPSAGATVPAGRIIVRGVVEAGGTEEAAVTVNGVVAAVSGTSFAVPLTVSEDTTSLLAAATTFSGATATHEIPITVTALASSSPQLSVTPVGGVSPLIVQFQLADVVPASVSLDLDGDGTPDVAGATLAGQRFTYAQPGLFVAHATGVDAAGAPFSASTVVHVESPAVVTARFQALWSGFKARLQANDVSGALAYLSPKVRADFAEMFQDLGSDLPAVAAGLENLVVLEQVGDLAEAAVLRPQPSGQAIFFIYFRRDARGLWLIEEM